MIITPERALSCDYSCPGLYSAIFFMYIHHQASKELGIDKRNIILYALCILYALSSATIVIDTTRFILSIVSKICIDYDNLSIHNIRRSSIRVPAQHHLDFKYSTLAMSKSQ